LDTSHVSQQSHDSVNLSVVSIDGRIKSELNTNDWFDSLRSGGHIIKHIPNSWDSVESDVLSFTCSQVEIVVIQLSEGRSKIHQRLLEDGGLYWPVSTVINIVLHWVWVSVEVKVRLNWWHIKVSL
jgi:hypothetical protein